MRGAFLSSSSRSAPPRDIMLEEPDVMNPGHSHSHVCVTFNRVFVYIIHTMPEKFNTSVLCIVCTYVHFQCASFYTIRSGTHSRFYAVTVFVMHLPCTP